MTNDAAANASPRPETVSLWDQQRIRDWQDYHLSGMASLISSANLCQALAALARSGLLARLAEACEPTVDVLLEGFDRKTAEGFLRYLTVAGVLEEWQGRYRLTRLGELLTGPVPLARLGFYLEAYGPVTSRTADLLTGAARYGADVQRAHGALARHSGTVTVSAYVPVVLRVLRQQRARHVVDLGCGDGSLLTSLCAADPGLSGVGLDIAAPAITAAWQRARGLGLGDRTAFALADAFDPATWPVAALQADVICGVGVLHELFRDGDEAVIDILNRYAKFLTGQQTLLIGEPELRYDNRENDSDFFLVHVLTAQGIPRDRDGWLAVFARTQLECRRVYDNAIAGPRTCFYELSPRKG